VIEGASCSRRGGAKFGLCRIGGGDRSLGETGHRGDSRKCSWAAGDLTGAPRAGSVVTGSRVGVVVEERVLTAEGAVGMLGRPTREGLTSWRLFFRDLVPGFVEDARETFVRERGRVGDGSREANGEGAADEDAEALEVWVVNLDGHESVFGVIVAVLVVDSRDSVGNGVWAALLGERERLGSLEPFATLADLSIFACIQGFGGAGKEEWRLVSSDGTCQSVY
jgi:hypothetical protein